MVPCNVYTAVSIYNLGYILLTSEGGTSRVTKRKTFFLEFKNK